MSDGNNVPLPADLESVVEAYERARAVSDQAKLDDFLPCRSHPSYREILIELARVDLELGLRQKQPRSLQDYRARFPEVFAGREALGQLAFEEYRLTRAVNGKTPADYRSEYGIDTSDWPSWTKANHSVASQPAAEPLQSFPASAAAAEFPQVGGRFGDFEIISELGRGAFARVYRAQQGELAFRFVALKVTVESNLEPQRLAELQHTNIVPIHSVHHDGELQAVCMPFLGATTLADVLEPLRGCTQLPASARLFVDQLAPEQDREFGSPTRPAGPSLPRHPTPGASSRTPDRTPRTPPSKIQSPLAGVSYVAAAAWIGLQVANGLAHAHGRGIIHRDLKPANILISNDGTPLLLDFNLSTAAEQGGAERAIVGGTLPYMAPELIRSLQTGSSVGTQCDIYGLGVVLFEMLSGRLPYPLREGPVESVIEQMLVDRQQPAPAIPTLNPRVSPDLAAIVRRCLAINPQHRYETVDQVRVDLERHLADLPPKFARGFSMRERVKKWTRRHPRLASGSSVAAAAAILLLVVSAGWLSRSRQLAEARAHEAALRLQQAVAVSSAPLAGAQIDLGSLRHAIDDNDQILRSYAAASDGGWRHTAPYILLNSAEQIQFRQNIAEIQFLLARGNLRYSKRLDDAELASARLDEAARLNRLVRDGFPAAPRAALELQAQILEARGQLSQAFQLRLQATAIPPQSNFENYLLVLVSQLGQADEPAVSKLCRDLPHKPLLWLIAGNLHYRQLRFSEAEFCYTRSIALEPQSFAAHWLRGIARFDADRHAEAEEDFERALHLRPAWPGVWFNRGLARQAQGRLDEAELDMTAALERGGTETRIYFARAKLRRARGDRDGAAADRRQGLERTPSDVPSWIIRGVESMGDPQQALADFRRAAELDPGSVVAWNNIAALLSSKLGQTAAAIEAMDQAVALQPNSIQAVATRGVLLARLGRREEAHRDAGTALALSQQDSRPDSDHQAAYLVAGIFAQTARQHPPDAIRALELLRRAAWAEPDFVLKHYPKDSDLRPLKSHPEFQRLTRDLTALSQAVP